MFVITLRVVVGYKISLSFTSLNKPRCLNVPLLIVCSLASDHCGSLLLDTPVPSHFSAMERLQTGQCVICNLASVKEKGK